MSGKTPGKGHRWGLILQTIFSSGLLIWLVFSINWPALLNAFAGVSVGVVAYGCFVYYTGVLMSCLKWQLCLRIEHLDLPFPRLVIWYLIGAFAGNALPTDIGGDLGRGYFAGRSTGKPLAVARSILVERLSGLMCMLGLAWIGVLVLFPHGIWALLAVPAGLLVLVTAPILQRNAAASALYNRFPQRMRNILSEIGPLLTQYRSRPAMLGQIMLISLGFQLLAGAGLWINMYAVGLDLPFIPVVLAAMIVGAIGLLPISINGWGVRETAIIALLTPLGAPAAGLLAGALLARTLTLVLSLPGALLLFYERRPSHRYSA